MIKHNINFCFLSHLLVFISKALCNFFQKALILCLVLCICSKNKHFAIFSFLFLILMMLSLSFAEFLENNMSDHYFLLAIGLHLLRSHAHECILNDEVRRDSCKTRLVKFTCNCSKT